MLPEEELLEVFILQLPPVLLDLSCKGALELETAFTDSVEWNRDIFLSREFLLIISLNSSLDNFPSAFPSFLRKTASTWPIVRWGEASNISTLLINPSPFESITLNKSSTVFVKSYDFFKEFSIYMYR